MAKFPLDRDTMFIEFPHIKRGLVAINLTDDTSLNRVIQMCNDNIYDYIGVREAFERAAKKYADESGQQYDYDKFWAKLERYMTAHLLCLYIYDEIQNLDDSPYVNQYAKLLSDKSQTDIHKVGNFYNMLQASNIGQRIIAMLPINTSNIGGSL